MVLLSLSPDTMRTGENKHKQFIGENEFNYENESPEIRCLTFFAVLLLLKIREVYTSFHDVQRRTDSFQWYIFQVSASPTHSGLFFPFASGADERS